MIQSLYLGLVEYEEGLRLQAEIAALVAESRAGNVLLLLEHPPVITLGRHAHRSNILASDGLLASRGVTVHEISRGGDVTYHGPGQLVGYPIFNLRELRQARGGHLGPKDFVHGMEEALIGLCGEFGVPAGRIAGLTGVWCPAGRGPLDESRGAKDAKSAAPDAKICAIGIHVSRGITSHGFAFNVSTDLSDFQLIIPCGIRDHPVTSLEKEMRKLNPRSPEEEPAALPTLEEVARRSARQFGLVFGEPVEAIDSLTALRAQAAAAPPQFPAEDTPLQLPPEVERLHGGAEGPVRA
jgi:lipoyl(octanoyl) transferase